MTSSSVTLFTNLPYLRLLETCSTMTQVKQIHAQLITVGLARFTYIASKLLAFCTLPETGNMSYAQALFNHIRIPSIFDFNSMIMGYSKTSKPEVGLLVFTQMRRENVEPNARTFPILAKACACINSLCQVHGQVIKNGHGSEFYVISSLVCMYSKFGAMAMACLVFQESVYKNIVCWTSLITGYCGNGMVDEAREVFDSMPEKNDVSCSAMVSGYVSNEHFNEAIELFCNLKCYTNVKLSKSLLLVALSACAAVGAFEEGKWIHTYLDENGFDYELELGTALVDFYSRCGSIETAEEIFTKIGHKDVTTWSAMILGLVRNGKNEMAFELFEEMELVGPKPNGVTFIGILAACNHKTLVSKAWRLFGCMSKVYGISPLIEHYGCMVDLLARAGRMKEAEILANTMPMEPDGAIWGSFLNGCLIHGHIVLGEKAGKHVIQLEPEHSGRYVLLSNMYATMGCWEGVMRLRRMMKERKVGTEAAWSVIEINGTMHRFVVDDKCHCQSRDIYKVLNQFDMDSIS